MLTRKSMNWEDGGKEDRRLKKGSKKKRVRLNKCGMSNMKIY
jgi:hypothetical protein